ncbi:MAG: DUF4388 domain-containing protein [Thermodesulfobacteriota bacterium]
MALKGLLKDFPITSIFQMISMEQKSGKLSVRAGKETITIEFDTGKVVTASHGSDIDERRLRLSLIKNNHISDEQWVEIKKECSLKLVSVWMALKNYVKQDILKSLINRHIEQVIFDLLSLKEGAYIFDTEAKIKIDKSIFQQVAGEYLLMEGYRIIDEWQEVVKVLPPMDTDVCVSGNLQELLSNTGYKTTDDEGYIISMASETTSIKDIVDASLIDKPGTGKALAKLISLGLLSIITDRKKTRIISTIYRWDWRGYAAIAAIVILSIGGFYLNYNDHISFYKEKVNRYRANTTKKSIGAITRSLNYYYTMHGEIPSTIHSLVDRGYLKEDEIIDPWGYPFIYKRHKDSFILSNKPH